MNHIKLDHMHKEVHGKKFLDMETSEVWEGKRNY